MRKGIFERERGKMEEGRFGEKLPGYIHIDEKELVKLPKEGSREVLFVAVG